LKANSGLTESYRSASATGEDDEVLLWMQASGFTSWWFAADPGPTWAKDNPDSSWFEVLNMTYDDYYESALRAKLLGVRGKGRHMPLRKGELKEYKKKQGQAPS
jgi:hypothetical protein